MTPSDDDFDDDELLAKLGDALTYDPQREPPESRVDAVRAEAEKLRSTRADATGDVPQPTTMPGRRRVLLAGIAAGFGAVAGYAGRDLTDDPASPAGPPTETIAFDSPSGVTATAALINHTWGAELLLDVTGLPADRNFRVVYEGPEETKDAGSFRSVADTLMKCRFNAAVLRQDLTAIVILDERDTEVMRAQVT